MKNAKKKFVTFTLLFLIPFFVQISHLNAFAQNFEKSITVLEGTTLQIPINYSDTNNLQCSDYEIAKVVTKDFYFTITGKQSGTCIATFQSPDNEDSFRYTITILPKNEEVKKAKQAYNAYLKKCKKGTKYAYTDLNHDGIKELYFADKIVYFNYQKQTLSTKKHSFKKLYVCNRNTLLFAELKKPRKTKNFIYYSAFYEFENTKPFAFSKNGKGFRTYTKVGKETYGVKGDYAFYDTHYDQDDYDYQSYTKKAVEKKRKKYMPAYKLVKLKKTVK